MVEPDGTTDDGGVTTELDDVRCWNTSSSTTVEREHAHHHAGGDEDLVAAAHRRPVRVAALRAAAVTHLGSPAALIV